MELDINKYKTQLNELLIEVNEAISRIDSADPAQDKIRDIDNNPEDDYGESEQGFRSGELLDDLKEKQDLIVSALKRIDAGTFGFDIDTHEPISAERLNVVPYATHNIAQEQNNLMD